MKLILRTALLASLLAFVQGCGNESSQSEASQTGRYGHYVYMKRKASGFYAKTQLIYLFYPGKSMSVASRQCEANRTALAKKIDLETKKLYDGYCQPVITGK